MQVDFYHLTRAPLEAVLPKLLAKALETGARAVVVARDEALLRRLDDHLWRHDPASFLPHGMAGDGDEDMQPVLLSATAAPLNGATMAFIADGIWPAFEGSFERVFFLFDETTIGNGREQWRRLPQPKRYWKQSEGGRWVEGP